MMASSLARINYTDLIYQDYILTHFYRVIESTDEKFYIRNMFGIIQYLSKCSELSSQFKIRIPK